MQEEVVQTGRSKFRSSALNRDSLALSERNGIFLRDSKLDGLRGERRYWLINFTGSGAVVLPLISSRSLTPEFKRERTLLVTYKLSALE